MPRPNTAPGNLRRLAELESLAASHARELEHAREQAQEQARERDGQHVFAAAKLALEQAHIDERRAELESRHVALADAEQGLQQRSAELEAWAAEQVTELAARAAQLEVRDASAVEEERALSENSHTEVIRDLEASRAQLQCERQTWEEARNEYDAIYRRQLDQIEEQLLDLNKREAVHEQQLANLTQAQQAQERQADLLDAARREIELERETLHRRQQLAETRLEQERAELERLRAQLESEVAAEVVECSPNSAEGSSESSDDRWQGGEKSSDGLDRAEEERQA